MSLNGKRGEGGRPDKKREIVQKSVSEGEEETLTDVICPMKENAKKRTKE